jgi:RNA polymerase sigma factor (sigma-70 family)
MASQEPVQDSEALFRQWLCERDQKQARALMDSLVRNHAEPLIRRIVTFKLDRAPDVEDVCSTVMYNLMARLARATNDGIRNFESYVAVTAYNACNEYFRARKPEWRRLEMKLRYLATHEPRFGLWQTSERHDICGFARDRGGNATRDIARITEDCRNLGGVRTPGSLQLGDLVEAIFERARAPLQLDDLVDVVVELSGIKETWVQSLDEESRDRTRGLEAVDSHASSEMQLRAKEYLQRLWREICDLPLEHRRALLLNLADSAGGDIQLFDLLGIATIRQIAATLEMDPVVFAGLWNKLPLDDTAIAIELGLNRQDVANRRSAARKRLARRMKEFEKGN